VTVETQSPAPRGLADSFYASALSEAEQAALTAALDVEGVDQEIAVLRVRLRQALEANPEDLALMFKGVDLLAKMVATRYRLSKSSERNLAAALAMALRSVREIFAEAHDGA
jgi:hypothetical protein